MRGEAAAAPLSGARAARPARRWTGATVAALVVSWSVAWWTRIPAALRRLPDPPLCLFIRRGGGGELRRWRLWRPVPAVAVVGTREPSPYGAEMAAAIGADLAKAGVVVVSGLAHGHRRDRTRAALGAAGAQRSATVGRAGLRCRRRVPALQRPSVRRRRWRGPTGQRVRLGGAGARLALPGAQPGHRRALRRSGRGGGRREQRRAHHRRLHDRAGRQRPGRAGRGRAAALGRRHTSCCGRRRAVRVGRRRDSLRLGWPRRRAAGRGPLGGWPGVTAPAWTALARWMPAACARRSWRRPLAAAAAASCLLAWLEVEGLVSRPGSAASGLIRGRTPESA